MDEKIMEYIKSKNRKGECANIVIAGCSCSGKTTISEELKAVYPGASILHEDDYFKNIEEIPRSPAGVLADRPDAFHTEEFVSDVKELIETGMVMTPIYDMSKNKRTSKTRMVKKGLVNIFEGLHTIQLLKGEIDCFAVYLDIPYDECLSRRVNRDGKNWNIGKEKVVSYWNRCVLPVAEGFIAPQKAYADIIKQE